MGCWRNRRWKLTEMFMLCSSSCFRAAEEEQAQSKKGLKKQQKEAEKAAKKAEKQAKLVSGLFLVLFFFPFLIHIRPPLLTAVRVSTCRAVGHCESRRCPYPQCRKNYPLFKYSCHLGFVYVHPNKALFFFIPTA